MTGDEQFPKRVRLRRQADFDAVFKNKSVAADNVLVIHAVANETDDSRLGLAVSRKVGNAVVRNRWKRTIREAFRRQRSELPTGLDIVVRPRKGAVCNYDGIAQSLENLMRRLSRKLKPKP